MITLDQLERVTVGPDGTIVGVRVGDGAQVVTDVAMYWIESAYWSMKPGAVMQLAEFQDGLGGGQPPDLNYWPAIRGSSWGARVRMLEVARRYVPTSVVAEHLGLSEEVLAQVVQGAYGV